MRSGKFLIYAIAVLTFTIFAASSFAADRYVRLRSVEGDVSIYSSDGDHEATMNTPLMDGDEIQTGDGRAELSFQNGIAVRIGDYSGLRLESSYSPMRIQLVQGTVFLDSHLIDRFRDELVLQAGDAEIILLEEGNIRVDLGSEGSVRVTTVEGQAEVMAGGRRVLLNSGERTYIDPGSDRLEPEEFRGDLDELDQWNQSRMDVYAGGDFGGGRYDDYVDDDIYYDAYDLGAYGDWRNSGSYGYVWVPHVEYGWRPYYDGRWSYYNSNWFWVSHEPWGWAPYHYGRWGWSLDFGWYWVPGNVFGPSWVSWYSYGDYVGWCPLNYYNYPVFYHDNFGRYPAIQKQKTLDATNSWTFVKKDDLGVKNIKKAVLDASHVRNLKIEKDKISRTPKKELVSYVLPQTKRVPGLVNDKRIIKQPGDIKSPIGTKHREEQFERSEKFKSGGTIPGNKGKSAERSFEKPSTTRGPVKIEPNRPQPKENSRPQPKDNFDRGGKSNPEKRDSQFKRNESSKQNYSPYSNPYYRGKPRTYDQENSTTRNYPSSRRPSDSYERPKDVNPKYRDEARKYFERFEHKNHGSENERSSPRSYETPKRSYEPPARNYEAPKRSYEAPKRSYEAPKREYKAPEVRRPDTSNRSNQNSNRKPSGSNSNDRKRNN